MINGVVVGTVKDNKDPEGMHRVLVEYPVDGDQAPASTWCRMSTPMAGKARGMVMLPDIGTEVVLGYGTRSMHPFVLGCVYNGAEDKSEPYANDDGDNNIRLFWSRAGSMVMFNDEPGKESVSIGATSGSRMDVKGGPIHQTLDAAEKTYTEYSDKDTIWEIKETLSIKCKNFKLIVDKDMTQEAGQTLVHNSKQQGKHETTIATYKAGQVHINGGTPLQPKPTKATPTHSHPPTVGGGGASAAAAAPAAPVVSQSAAAEALPELEPVLQVGPGVMGLSDLESQGRAPDGSKLSSALVLAQEPVAEDWTSTLPAPPEHEVMGGSWVAHPHEDHVHGHSAQSAQDESGGWSKQLPVAREPAAPLDAPSSAATSEAHQE
jgi:hypothetical protein